MFDFTQPHTSGVEFFRLKDKQILNAEDYFDCLDYLRLLLESSSFNECVIGFYVSAITDENDKEDSVRVTYFTSNPMVTKKEIDSFVESDSYISIFKSNHTSRPSDMLGNMNTEDINFYTFLCINTRILMDMVCVRSDINFISGEVMSYRNFGFNNGIDPKKYFKQMFVDLSEFFTNKIQGTDFEELYWDSITKDFGVGKGTGLHFMINFIFKNDHGYQPFIKA